MFRCWSYECQLQLPWTWFSADEYAVLNNESIRLLSSTVCVYLDFHLNRKELVP